MRSAALLVAVIAFTLGDNYILTLAIVLWLYHPHRGGRRRAR